MSDALVLSANRRPCRPTRCLQSAAAGLRCMRGFALPTHRPVLWPPVTRRTTALPLKCWSRRATGDWAESDQPRAEPAASATLAEVDCASVHSTLVECTSTSCLATVVRIARWRPWMSRTTTSSPERFGCGRERTASEVGRFGALRPMQIEEAISDCPVHCANAVASLADEFVRMWTAFTERARSPAVAA